MRLPSHQLKHSRDQRNRLRRVPARGKPQRVSLERESRDPRAVRCCCHYLHPGIAGLNAVTGTTPRTGNQNIFFSKIDWQINGYGRDFEYETDQNPAAYEQTTLLSPAAKNPYGIPPNVDITNRVQIGTPTFLNRPAYPDERRYEISDTLNLVRGNHNLKLGMDFIHTNDLSENLFSQYGGYSYGGSNYTPFVEYITDINKTKGCSTTINRVATPVECYTNFSQGLGPQGSEFQIKDTRSSFRMSGRYVPGSR